MPRRWSAALAALVLPSQAWAGRCENIDRIGECWNQFQPAQTVELAVQREAVWKEQELRLLETGADIAGLVSTVKNFLPLLSVSGVAAAAAGGAGETGQRLGLDLNPPTPAVLSGNRLQSQGDVNPAPKLGPALREALVQAGEDDRIAQLEQGLDSLDDSTLVLTYGFEYFGFGRDFRDHQKRLEALLNNVYGKVLNGPDAGTQHQQAYLDLLVKLDLPAGTKRFSQIANREKREQLRAAVEAAGAEAAADLDRLNRARRDRGLDHFSLLLNNQPQLYVSYRLLFRDPLVGADAYAVRLSYESSGKNLSDFEDGYGASACAEKTDWRARGSDSASDECVRLFSQYALDETVLANRRYAIYTEYGEIDGLSLRPAGTSVRVDTPPAKALSLGAGYGQFLQPNGFARLDASARYTYFDIEAADAELWEVSLVYTQRIAGLSIPFSLVYRSDADVHAGAGDQVLGMLGVNFDQFLQVPQLPLAESQPRVVPLLPADY